jgi:anthranilate synthase component I
VSTKNSEDTHPRTDGIVRLVAGERFTPYTLARKLDAKVILESSSFKKGKERYSILLVKEAFKVVQLNGEVLLVQNGKSRRIKGKSDILDLLPYFAGQHPSLQQDLPVPAGGIGFLSYEFASYCDTIRFKKKKDPLQLPDAAFIFGHIFVVFDHYTDMLYLIGLNYKESTIDLAEAIAGVENSLDDLNFNYLAPSNTSYNTRIIEDDGEKKTYLDGVKQVREEIIKGNLLQGVLSRRLEIETDLPAIEAYKNLRSVNPSPYLFYLDFGDYQLFGSSPEVHVKVKNGRGEIHPLAGTRRRGKGTEEDENLKQELLADEKEKAEHLMLVDLARNDLGRISVPKSVEVTEFMEVEFYSHVMHIVSKVESSLLPGTNGLDAIRATFPAGTVSGAPKIRAVETIDAMEKEPRRFYAGLVGYLEAGGNLDTCITIRSALKKDGYLYLQAGAGIVYDSDPERELQETDEKLGALLKAIGLEKN